MLRLDAEIHQPVDIYFIQQMFIVHLQCQVIKECISKLENFFNSMLVSNRCGEEKGMSREKEIISFAFRGRELSKLNRLFPQQKM